jgi:hypothetical protein
VGSAWPFARLSLRDSLQERDFFIFAFANNGVLARMRAQHHTHVHRNRRTRSMALTVVGV